MPTKEQFGVNMEEQLDKWRRKMEEAKARADAQGPELLEKLRPDFDKMSAHYEEAKYKLKLLRMGGEDAWEDMRGGFEKAFGDLKDSLERALSRF